MQSGTDLVKKLLDAILPNRAAPVLARVLKAHEGSGKTKYSVDVRVLKAGTLEDTDQVIQEVPISPIWASKKKRGVYAIPPDGQVVIVEFLHWNPAYPFVAGIWADEYEADDFSKDKFIITDGDGMKIIVDSGGKKITFDNGKKSIVTIEEGKIRVDTGRTQIVLNGDKVAIKNNSKSLFTVLDTTLGHIATFAQNVLAHSGTSQADIIKFTLDAGNLAKDKSDLAGIMEA